MIRSRMGSPPSPLPRRGSGEQLAVSLGSFRATSAATTTTLVLIRCAPGSDILEPTHAYISAYATARFGNRAAERLSVAAYELFANAMSYGTLADVCVELVETTTGGGVRVANTTTPARLGMLRAHLEKLERDAGETMANEMRRFAGGGARPMLGLARIRHEVGMELDVDVTGDRVTILARAQR